MLNKSGVDVFLFTGADPGCLDRGFKFAKGVQFVNYLIVINFFLIFLKILHENEIILSQRGV